MGLAKSVVYGLLGLITLAGVVSTFWTLIPDSSAKVNLMGTKTHCPLVPYSTIGSVVVAVVGLILFLIARHFWR